ncbi:MAG: protein-glutamate O-methyltransferase CheR [Deltaproteobacteria bacterium]|nr:protein-glutamate O-methyltransferase CheR [Deltaproteobacteria bacterium]
MTLPISTHEFFLLRSYIEEQSGIRLGDDKSYLVENRLSNLVLECGCSSFTEFYHRIRYSPQAHILKDAVLDAIATNETLWFRDRHPFRVLRETVLPRLQEEIETGRRERIAIWSAACSTGQEPYSIAMTALDLYSRRDREKECERRIRITASDVSGRSLAAARAGSYSEAAICRGLPPAYLHRYFQKAGNCWEIEDRVRDMISFTQYNLKVPPPRTFGSFDLVFLRNVIIYFSDEFKRTLFEKVAGLMSPRGFLFLGTGETITGYTETFEPVEDAGCIYYRIRP